MIYQLLNLLSPAPRPCEIRRQQPDEADGRLHLGTAAAHLLNAAFDRGRPVAPETATPVGGALSLSGGADPKAQIAGCRQRLSNCGQILPMALQAKRQRVAGESRFACLAVGKNVNGLDILSANQSARHLRWRRFIDIQDQCINVRLQLAQ